METLQFRVDGGFIMDLAREGYWFGNRREWAIRLLKTLHGISDDQIQSILNGGSTLVGISPDILLHPTPDKEFKEKLAKQKEFIAKYYVELAGHSVPREHLELYAQHVVKRLREAINHPSLYAESPMTLFQLEGTEEISP